MTQGPLAAAPHVAGHLAALHHIHPVHAIVIVHAVIILHPHNAAVAAKAVRAAVSRAAARISAAVSALTARKPRISVITPTWQRARLLTRRCIPSVLAQDYEGEIEHVIVSDGPDPDLADVPGITYLPGHRHNPNRGIWARMHGTAIATGDIFAYL